MTTLGYLRAAREWAYPTLKSSAFLEKGVLTPEEFVKAGDELVFRCPTWSWEAGDSKKKKSYLPKDKQYLITRNVPCQTRVSEMENHLSVTELAGEGNDGDDDWLVSNITKQVDDTRLEDEFDILDEQGEIVKKDDPKKTSGGAAEGGDNHNEDDGDDDEYADMEDFEDDNVLQDDDAAEAITASDETAAAAAATTTTTGNDEHLVKVRTYNLSITYDKYYQTPRVWMVGTSVEGQPLSGKEMMEDVMSDYANRTVTIESHPHVTGPHASIHPCQHSKVMKTIVRNLIKASDKQEGEKEVVNTAEGPSIEMYLFIFLKFVSSIIPTINYDFTMDVTADTSK